MLDAAYKHYFETKSQNQCDNSAVAFGMQQNLTENRREHAVQKGQASNTP